MRFGFKKVPFRVLITSVSLAGLGVAAALPTIASDVTGNGIDLIITNSTSEVDTSEPTLTAMPDDPAVAPQVVPRQVLPRPEQSSATVTNQPSAPQIVDQNGSMIAETPTDNAIVSPMMDDAMAPMPQQGLSTSLAGEATDAGGVVLALDHARVMRVVGDVATIIIGNPSIADASMPDPGTIVLTGKSYGETNMVMLDVNGGIIAEQTLRVTVRGQSLVSVYRGVQRTTLSCAPTCEIRPTPGDNADAVTAGLSQFEARNQAALDAVRGD